MLRLAFSSNAYLDVPVEQAIARIAGFGYSGIELLADVPHAWPAGASTALPTFSPRTAKLDCKP